MARIQRSELEVIDPSTVKLRGYAAVFNNEFSYYDLWSGRRRFVVEPGAFDGVLERLGGEPLPVFWSHEVWKLQIGQTTVLEQDDTGLYFEAQLFTTSEVLDVAEVIDKRARTGASFMFEYGEITEDDEGVEHLVSFSEMFELGPCPVGANPKAWAELADTQAAKEDQDPAAEPDKIEEPPEPAAAEDAEFAAAAWALAQSWKRRSR